MHRIQKLRALWTNMTSTFSLWSTLMVCFSLCDIPSWVLTDLGFVYTQTNDRLWRKNRQTLSGNSCVGRDINRNWPYMWSVPGGASTDPCAEDYKGDPLAWT